ncbi:MAG: hypothetical protein Kow0059_21540 [Candidatus Sumerlaeia bacterium]
MSQTGPTPQPAPAPDAPDSPGRRRVLNVLLGGSFCVWLGSAVYPVVRYLIPPAGQSVAEKSVKVGTVGDFPNNSGTIFRFGNKPGLLIRTQDGELRAFIAVCTHLDCTVQYKKEESVIWCACHNGKYNLKGINISGPPPRPLTPLTVVVKGEDVYVSQES